MEDSEADLFDSEADLFDSEADLFDSEADHSEADLDYNSDDVNGKIPADSTKRLVKGSAESCLPEQTA